MRSMIIAAAIAAGLVLTQPVSQAAAAGCLRIVNVAPGDTLAVRARPTVLSRIVTHLPPKGYGRLYLDSPCVPQWRPWGKRWCPVTNFRGGNITHGYVRARFIRDKAC